MTTSLRSALLCASIAVAASGTSNAAECTLTPRLIGAPVKLSPSETGNMDDIAVAYNDRDREFLVTWFDSRITGQNNVYAQRLSEGGVLIGENATIIAGPPAQFDTAIAFDPTNHRYLVTWTNQSGPPGSAGFNHTFGRLVSATAVPIGDEFEISNGGLEPTLLYNSVQAEFFLTARNFAGGGEPGLRGQRVATSGALIGEGISIAPGGAPMGRTAFNKNDNEYLATWLDFDTEGIAARVVHADGSLGPVNPLTRPVITTRPSAAFDPAAERYLVALGDITGGPISGRLVDPAGSPLGQVFVIAATQGTGDVMVMHEPLHGVFMVAWLIDPDLEIRLVSVDAELIGDRVTVSSTARGAPVLAYGDDGRVVVTWIDKRDMGQGVLDVYAQMIGVVPTGACPEDIDCDGFVALGDLTAILGSWGLCDFACAEDLNGDGTIGFIDLTTLLSRWGECR